MSTLLQKFTNRWQAERVAAHLEKLGIAAQVVGQPREYTAIVLGSSESPTEVWVEPSDLVRAQDEVRSFLREHVSLANEDELSLERRNHFRPVIVFSLLGVLMLPIVFNWVATTHAFQLQESRARTILAFVILMLGWLIAVSEIVFLFYPIFRSF